jgi:uncharacterized protein (DUF1800 family)
MMLESGMENAETATGVTTPSGRLTAAALAASSVLAACGGGGGDPGSASGTGTGTTALPTYAGRAVNLTAFKDTKPSSDDEAARFLLQAQFHASDADIASVKALGYRDWLKQQYAMPFTSGWDWMQSQGYGDATSSKNFYDLETPTDYMMWHELMATSACVRKRIALALSEYFVVSVTGLDITWRSQVAASYWDILCTHGLGNFRDLLEAVTLSPAMGKYLNTLGNLPPNKYGRLPDENFARELMQLFTIGLEVLNEEGVGQGVDTYTADDIRNLAHVFTGYALDQRQNRPIVVTRPGQSNKTIPSVDFTRLPMWVNSVDQHSSQGVTVFAGTLNEIKIDPNTAAAPALKIALDGLFNHPNLPPFFCKQMIQRLVTSNPSPAYVQSVVKKFQNNGQGVRGDLACVFTEILMNPEARSIVAGNESGKLREPMLRLVQWARTFGATSKAGTWLIGDQSDMGHALSQSPLRSPSVFNFFRPGYVPPATSLNVNKVQPEFQLVNESSVAAYLNMMSSVISGGLAGGDVKASYTKELALAANEDSLVKRLNLLLCANQLSAGTVTEIVNALKIARAEAEALPTKPSLQAIMLNRVYAAVLLVMASPEYLIQK